MNCPACGSVMVEQDFGGVKVDVCAGGCRGIWFDWFELSKLDEKNEGFGAALKAAMDDPRSNGAGRGQLHCPKCGIPMHAHKYQSSKDVNVDECYLCGGFFLDSGELSAIRESFMDEEEREAYARKLIDDIPEFGRAVEEAEKNSYRAKSIRIFSRYL